MHVQVLMYSGVANPEFYLTEQESAELERRVALLELRGQMPGSQLGYMGFRVCRNSGDWQKFVRVHPGVVVLGNETLLADDRGVEAYLLDIAKHRIGTDHPSLHRVPVRKVTEFVGQASGDCECFCFDRRTSEEIAQHRFSHTEEGRESNDANRIYPHDLLPEVGPARGRWKIIVEFTPED